MLKVSVIVPVYNVAPYLRRGIDSLINQTLKDIEIICIDDKSTDNSLEILREYESRDPRVHVIALPKNGGAAVARNAGMDIATGEYFGFLDPDDFLDLDFYEKLYSSAKNSDADITRGETRIVKINDRPYMKHQNGMIERQRAAWASHWWTAIYRRKFLLDKGINFPVGIMTGQDAVFLIKAITFANKISFANDAVYNYFKGREGSLDSKFLPDAKVKSKLAAENMIIDFINTVELDPEAYMITFNARVRYVAGTMFSRAMSIKLKLLICDELIKIYEKCRHKFLLAKLNPDVVQFVADKNVHGLYYLLRAKDINSKTHYKIFNLFSILTVKNRPDKKEFRLFGIFPLLVLRFKAKRVYCRLFGVVPLLTIRNKSRKSILRLFGFLPILKLYFRPNCTQYSLFGTLPILTRTCP